MTSVARYAAFTDRPDGGNPAGVVLDARGMDEDAMQAVAAELGYSESAFLVPRDDGAIAIRYFSPQAEVPFCGHATIAAGVAWAEAHGPGPIALDTASGRVDVDIQVHDGALRATLTSVRPARRSSRRPTSTTYSLPCAGTRPTSTLICARRWRTPARSIRSW